MSLDPYAHLSAIYSWLVTTLIQSASCWEHPRQGTLSFERDKKEFLLCLLRGCGSMSEK